MGREGNSKDSVIVSKEVKEWIISNRKNVPTKCLYGGEEVRIESGRLYGGHFKLQSVLKACGLSYAERKQALAKEQ